MMSKVTMYWKRNEETVTAAGVCLASALPSTRKGTVGRRGGHLGQGNHGNA